MSFRLRIGTRPSALARSQATIVQTQLEGLLSDLRIQIVPISTSGDKMTAGALAKVGGKGLFVREIELALISGRIDIAVHSVKDMPAITTQGLRIAAVPTRENPRDALISRSGGAWAGLGPGARLGTSSARRRLQALRLRGDLDVLPLRGNVDTRLHRLEVGEFDAIILAMAGLKRLGRCEGIKYSELDERDFVPSGGQGALAVQTRAKGPIGGSVELEQAVANLNDPRSFSEVTAERAFLATIGASCLSPVGVKANLDGGTLHLRALLFSLDGARSLAGEIAQPHQIAADGATSGKSEEWRVSATSIGTSLAHQLLARGAAEMVQGE